jgi:tetratricopeptide (TPR) repeat protein
MNIRFSRILILPLLLLLAVALAYAPTLDNGWVWDDTEYVVENPHLRELNSANLAWMWTGTRSMNWNPLTWWSLAVDQALSAGNPAWFHAVNVVLHGFNTLWVFGIALVLLNYQSAVGWNRRVGLRRIPPLPGGMVEYATLFHPTYLPATIAALLFAVHPLHVESVAWVTERKDVLCLFFLLPSLLAYLFYAQTRRRYWYFLALLGGGLAMAAKPLAVTLPVLLLLLDIYPLRRFSVAALLEKLPFFALTALVIWLTMSSQSQAMPTQFALDQRILNAFHSLLFYPGKWLFPLGLSPYYPYPPYSLDWHSLLPVAGVVLITALCLYLFWQGRRAWLILWLFYVISLSPMIGIIQVGTQAAADRYAYLPILPLHLLAGIGAAWLIQRKTWTAAPLALLLLGLLLLTRQQATVWRNEVSLWQHAASHAPHSELAQNNLATAYVKAGDYAAANQRFRLLTRMFPDNATAYHNLAETYMQAGQWQEAEAAYGYLLATVAPIPARLPRLYTDLARLALRRNDTAQARQFIAQALALNPNYAPALQARKEIGE